MARERMRAVFYSARNRGCVTLVRLSAVTPRRRRQQHNDRSDQIHPGCPPPSADQRAWLMNALQLRIEHQDELAAHAIRVLEPDRVECAEILRARTRVSSY